MIGLDVIKAIDAAASDLANAVADARAMGIDVDICYPSPDNIVTKTSLPADFYVVATVAHVIGKIADSD